MGYNILVGIMICAVFTAEVQGSFLSAVQPCWEDIEVTTIVQRTRTTTRRCGFWGFSRCRRTVVYYEMGTNRIPQCCSGYQHMPDCNQFTSAEGVWEPQIGTAELPKSSGSWPSARPGDVVSVGGQLFTAAVQIDLTTNPTAPSPELEALDIGTIRHPKNPNSDPITNLGELYYDDETHILYSSECTVYTTIFDCLSPVNPTEHWMTLLNPYIAPRRLGDLTWPGSHDAATAGIDLDAEIIDQEELYLWAQFLGYKQTLVNWAKTQTGSLQEQLGAGFRYLDLRIAYVNSIAGSPFYWWHGLTGSNIEQGLDEIATFAVDHPQEILILHFIKFASPGNSIDAVFPMTTARLDEVGDILLNKLSHVAVSDNISSLNPTVQDVLNTGRNVFILVDEVYLVEKSEFFWNHTEVLVDEFRGMQNTEDLFNNRSMNLEDFMITAPDSLTKQSGAITADDRVTVASLYRMNPNNLLLNSVMGILYPGITIDPDQMSFEGLWTGSVEVARYGTNTVGMYARDPARYSNGVSVHYNGTNDMYRHWLARPDRYKPSIMMADDVTVSSTFVYTALRFNMGHLKRETSITYQGTPTHGKYEWVQWTAINGNEADNCDLLDIQVDITSAAYAIAETYSFQCQFQVFFIEGQYPVDTTFTVHVGSDQGPLHQLTTGVIQDFIDGSMDLYIRGTDQNGVNGFAYTSSHYALFADSCSNAPVSGYDTILTW